MSDDETTGLFHTKPTDRTTNQATFPIRLVVVKGTELGRRFIVSGPSSLGRSSSADVPVNDAFVSRVQASIFAGDAGAYIRHLSQRTPTAVNGSPIDECPLAWGDKIEVGATIMMVTPQETDDTLRIEKERIESLGHLTAGIAHDFNNMLGVMVGTIGYLRELGERSLTETEVRDCLDDLDSAVTRSTELVARILGFVRREQEQHVLFDMGALCSEVVTLSMRAFPRSIRVHTDVGHGLWVRGARAQLAHVLMNLLINARDAMPNGGGLTVTADHHGHNVRLLVADTGHGMDEATQARAFDPLFSTKGQGTGLGLATVADVVRWHGGAIEVDSELGRGTAFTIRLPRGDKSASDRMRRPTSQVRTATERRVIMVVDDDPIVRRSLVRLLELDHDVIEVEEARLAAAIYHRDRPDLVLLDLDMAPIGGRDVWYELQGSDHVAPIAFVSGDLHGLTTLEEDGALVLRKPFGLETLRRFVFDALDGAA